MKLKCGDYVWCNGTDLGRIIEIDNDFLYGVKLINRFGSVRLSVRAELKKADVGDALVYII